MDVSLISSTLADGLHGDASGGEDPLSSLAGGWLLGWSHRWLLTIAVEEAAQALPAG